MREVFYFPLGLLSSSSSAEGGGYFICSGKLEPPEGVPPPCLTPTEVEAPVPGGEGWTRPEDGPKQKRAKRHH